MVTQCKKLFTTVDSVTKGKELVYEISLWELSSVNDNVAKRVATRTLSIPFLWDVTNISTLEKEVILDHYLRIMKVPQIEPTLEFFKEELNWKSLVSKLNLG